MLLLETLPKIYDILVFRGSPAEMPHSKWLFFLSYGAFFILLTALVRFVEVSWTAAVWKAVLFIVVQSLFSLIVLQIRGMEGRFIQTMSAFISSQFFIIAVFLVPYVLLSQIVQTVLTPWKENIMIGLSAILVLSASIWLYLLASSIYEAALEIKTLGAGFVALLLLALQALVFSQLYF